MMKYFVDSDSKVQEAIELLGNTQVIGVDTETDGLNFWSNTLWCIQISNGDVNMLFPYHAMNEESRQLLRGYLRDKTMVAHNAKFDYKFLRLNGFDVKDIHCTQIVEKCLYQGKYFTWGLKDLVLRRFQVQMSKEERTEFHDGTLTKLVAEYGPWGAWEQAPHLVEYALEDIVYLTDIRDQQLQEASECGMDNVLRLENSVIRPVAEIELRGVYLDRDAVKKFESLVTERRDTLGHEIFTLLEKSWGEYWLKEFTRRMDLWNRWQLDHRKVVEQSNKMRDPSDKRRKSEDAKKMVDKSLKKKPFAVAPKPENQFNPNSPLKLKPALSNLVGFEIPNTTKDWLEENIGLHTAIETLVEYRKFEKLAQFCQLTEDINPVTGRIHGQFNQAGTESGRFSSSDPNLQQIPARSEEAKQFRALFKPRPGYKYIQADYAGLELVIIAEASEEDVLVEAINRGDDLHCFTMSIMIGCPYDILVKLKDGEEISFTEEGTFLDARERFESTFSMPELKKVGKTKSTQWVKKFRDYVKTITYGTAYGLSEFGMSNKFHCTVDDAKSFIKLFFDAYPSLGRFLKTQGELGFQRGYALNPFGRRRYLNHPKKKSYGEVEQGVIKELNAQKRLWDSVEDKEWEELMTKAINKAEREYKSKLNSIRRRAANFYPQSVNADMIKVAIYLFDKYFEGGADEGLILTVHDELIAEVKEENLEAGVQALQKAMETAGRRFLKKVNIEVDVQTMNKWEK